MSGAPGYVRWTPEEWQRVAANALPFIDRGKDLGLAVQASQRLALPPDRRKPAEECLKYRSGPTARKYIDDLRALARTNPSQYAELIVEQPERKPRANPTTKTASAASLGKDYRRTDGTIVRWTTREWSLVARQVKAWRDAGDGRSTARLIMEAQEVVIDEERRRPHSSIQQGAHLSKNDRQLAEGLANLWTVEAAERAQAQADAAQATAAALAAANAIASAEAAAGATPVTSPPQDTPQDTPAEPASGPQAASAAPLRALHTSVDSSQLSEAARAFGETVMGALDGLLAVHARAVIANVLPAVDAKLSSMAASLGAQVATMIETSMQTAVRAMVEAELGGPLGGRGGEGGGGVLAERSASAPADDDPDHVVPTGRELPRPEHLDGPQPEEPEEEPEEEVEAADRPRRLKVDVIGLNLGGDIQKVQAAFNGSTHLRFFDADSKSSYKPHKGRECILLVERIPHALRTKAKAAGVEPIVIRGRTPGHVIHAIEELHRAAGVPV